MRAVKQFGLAIVVLAASAGWYASRADDDSRMVIIAAMRRVFSGQDPPLVQRAAAGDANEVEKQRLLKVLTGLANTQPDRGSVDSVEGQDRRPALGRAGPRWTARKAPASGSRGVQLPGLSRGASRHGRRSLSDSCIGQGAIDMAWKTLLAGALA